MTLHPTGMPTMFNSTINSKAYTNNTQQTTQGNISADVYAKVERQMQSQNTGVVKLNASLARDQAKFSGLLIRPSTAGLTPTTRSRRRRAISRLMCMRRWSGRCSRRTRASSSSTPAWRATRLSSPAWASCNRRWRNSRPWPRTWPAAAWPRRPRRAPRMC